MNGYMEIHTWKDNDLINGHTDDGIRKGDGKTEKIEVGGVGSILQPKMGG